MKYTVKMQLAIKFATKTHDVYQKQKRKGKEMSYIEHPLTAGLILARCGASEDVIIAGILHDTIEDSVPEKKVTHEMLEERFGRDVADLVLAVTEEDKEESWEVRKKKALAHIEDMTHDALLVKSADVLSNTTELVDDHMRDGDMIFERFNASKERSLTYYILLIDTILDVWPENPLAEDLKNVQGFLKKNMIFLEEGKLSLIV
jgi:(p)ppGpp synthase/HD superfamily hydrolase